GLDAAKGVYLTTAWYWDQDDESRAWAERFEKKMDKKPSMLQAGDYSAATTYLKAVQATGTTDGDTVMNWLRNNKIEDFFLREGKLREDGLMLHDMYLMQVKTPAESKSPWDYYTPVARLDGNDIYTSLEESTCK